MVTVSTGDGRWRLVPKAPFSTLIQVHNRAKLFLVVDRRAFNSRNQFFVMPVSCLHLFELIQFTWNEKRDMP